MKRTGETTVVPLELEPFESAFVVLKTVKDATDTGTAKHAEIAEATGGSSNTNYPEPQTVTVLSGPWTLTFDPAQRGPATPVVTGTLFDWSTSEDNAVRYYSGEVIYQTEFDLPEPAASSLFINLGDVMVMAKVKVNGKEVGGVWTAPLSARYIGCGANRQQPDRSECGEHLDESVNRRLCACSRRTSHMVALQPVERFLAFAEIRIAGTGEYRSDRL